MLVRLIATATVVAGVCVTLAAAQRDGIPAAGAAAGTGRISGHVVLAADATRPVRRAIVTLRAASGRSRGAVTDDQGAFAFEGLDADRFTLTASRPAYLDAAYGAAAPGRAGTSIALASGQSVDATIYMTRGAVIIGTIRDRSGAPMPNVQVGIARAGARSLSQQTSQATVETDDRGMYRAFGLAPGDYLVATWTTAGTRPEVRALTMAYVDAKLAALAARGKGLGPSIRAPAPATDAGAPVGSLGLVPIFFPGTAVAGDASTVTVGPGEERTGIDIVFEPVSASTIEGTVSLPAGVTPPVAMSLTSEDVSPIEMSGRAGPTFTLAQPPGADGVFRYVGVPPGRYILGARSGFESVDQNTTIVGQGAASGALATHGLVLWASAPVVVSGSDVTNVSLSLRPALHVTGRIVFDGDESARPEPSRVSLMLGAPENARFSVRGGTELTGQSPVPPAVVDADGTFEFFNVLPGRYEMRSTTPEGWRLQSAVIDGRDLLDTPLDVPPYGGDVHGAVVTLTSRHNELAGRIETADGAPAAELFVLVFTTDRSLWRAGGRRLFSTRPGTDDEFAVRDLPAGEYYLAALTDVDPNDWQRADFLDAVARAALRLTIGDGERRRQDVRMAR